MTADKVRRVSRLANGDVHPAYRESRAKFRAPPERLTRRMKAWRVGRRARFVRGSGGAPNAAVVWEGLSRFDGTPIVVIATGMRGLSKPNVKTGDMVQLYILPLDRDPTTALHTGEDRAVCGSCPHRPSTGGDCYVNVSWAPRNLWRMYQRGGMARLEPGALVGAAVRFGAWGDPAAVPLEVWRPIVDGAFTHTGYTQRWHELDVEAWGWLMASVMSPLGRDRAHARGWRTFRVVYSGEVAPVAERECLATAHGITCLACGGCAGNDRRHADSYWIRVHGMRKRKPSAKEAT